MFPICLESPTYSFVQKPDQDDWVSNLQVSELERSVNQTLQDLYQLATDKGAPHVSVLAKMKVTMGNLEVHGEWLIA